MQLEDLNKIYLIIFFIIHINRIETEQFQNSEVVYWIETVRILAHC